MEKSAHCPHPMCRIGTTECSHTVSSGLPRKNDFFPLPALLEQEWLKCGRAPPVVVVLVVVVIVDVVFL